MIYFLIADKFYEFYNNISVNIVSVREWLLFNAKW
jgi:hypothetical protein